MKQIVFLLFLLSPYIGSTQDFTFRYTQGFGTFDLDNIKQFQKTALTTVVVTNSDGIYSQLKGIKIVDDFPAQWTQSFSVGVALKQHNFGLVYSRMSTGGRNNLTDYSGSYNLDMKVRANKFGAFYRIYLADLLIPKLQPFLQASIGASFNKLLLDETIRVFDVSQNESINMKSTNYYIEPSFGFQYRLHKFVALETAIGYDLQPLIGDMNYQSSNRAMVTEMDWSGLRVGLGLTLFIPN